MFCALMYRAVRLSMQKTLGSGLRIRQVLDFKHDQHFCRAGQSDGGFSGLHHHSTLPSGPPQISFPLLQTRRLFR